VFHADHRDYEARSLGESMVIASGEFVEASNSAGEAPRVIQRTEVWHLRWCTYAPRQSARFIAISFLKALDICRQSITTESIQQE
jgi:hypothetical protein